MAFFGARTVRAQMKNIIGLDEELQENAASETDTTMPLNAPSISQLDACPNEIEFEKLAISHEFHKYVSILLIN